MKSLLDQIKHSVKEAAKEVKKIFGTATFSKAIILGTGWGSINPPFKILKRIMLKDLYGFNNLTGIAGHKRELIFAKDGKKNILILSGRLHLNERQKTERIENLVRMEMELVIALGCKKLVLTCAAGGLQNTISVGDIIVAKDLCTLFSPTISPLVGGEFVNLTEALDAKIAEKVINTGKAIYKKGNVISGIYAMVPGPFFETQFDKMVLASLNIDVVGMSLRHEVEVAALHNVKVVALCFITNGINHTSHEENLDIGKQYAKSLQPYLKQIIKTI